jgi:hypothetical protein
MSEQKPQDETSPNDGQSRSTVVLGNCTHIWVANSGSGGAPRYRIGMCADPVMHVMCELCGDRTWFTQEQWAAIPSVMPNGTKLTGAPHNERNESDEH